MFGKIFPIPKPISVKPIANAQSRVKRGWDFTQEEWRTFLENAKGEKFLDKAKALFNSKDIGELDIEKFEELIVNEVNHIRFLAEAEDDRYNIEIEYQKQAFDDVFYKVCTYLALEQSREELTKWVGMAEKGKALFVDAIMGLGKTYSIVKALGSDLTKSAVIFMPTRRLCYEMCHNLKTEIYINHPHIRTNYLNVVSQVEAEVEHEFVDFHDKNSYFSPVFRWTREYLEDEVYWADGINEKECLHYKDLTERYKKNWIKKKDICSHCAQHETCRFRRHWEKAPLSRIVITTHSQYDNFYQNTEIYKWYKHGIKQEDKAVERDFFIVDEDLVLSQCYHPVSLSSKELKDFTATIINFLKGYDDTASTIKEIRNLHSIVGEVGKTSLVKPLQPDFKFPDNIKKAWDKSFLKQEQIIPDTLDWSDTIGNHLEVLETAFNLGFTIEKYQGSGKTICFPNPKTYDLSNLPPHVFFDGTMLEKKFLHKKLNVEFCEHPPFDVKPIWDINIWQNINTHLPKWNLKELELKIQAFIKHILDKRGLHHKYLFIATKIIAKKYLEPLLKEKYPDIQKEIMYYGNLKGINDAQDCDICIMLGSYLLSDAVEIAMALEFIQDVIPERETTVAYGKDENGGLWSWKNRQRVYWEKYHVVSELSKAVRHSEQRQALARTRYLFHDVDFYIVSKDKVKDFDSFLPMAIDEQYLSIIFKPISIRENSLYWAVKDIVEERLKVNEPISRKDIFDNYKEKLDTNRIDTIGEHLRRLAGDGFLVKKGNSYYDPDKE